MRYLLLGVFTITLFSCSNVSSPPDNVPKEFEEGNSSSFSFERSGGGGSDAVTSLYNEVADDDANLKSLEKDIRNLSGNIADASEPFNTFTYNNSNYYNSATNHLNSIRDSALKAKAKALIDASMNQYQRSVAMHNRLINEINWKQVTLNDVHTYLKLARTLPVIENYQKKNLPSTSALENASAEMDKVIQRTKDASKQ
jgi:hypothetical protein